MLKALWLDEQGQDLIEYALIAAFVATAAPAIWGTQYMTRLEAVIARVGEVLLESIE
jgi:Flp pilus assembly pilin Flp